MNGLKTIINKELSRVFKDKKMIFSMFVLPIILVGGIFLLVFTLISNMMEGIENHVSTVYIQYAPDDFKGLISTEEGLDLKFFTDDLDMETAKADIKDGNLDLVIVFPENFSETVKNDETKVLQVSTYYNPSEDYSSEARTKFVEGYLEVYRQSLVAERVGDISRIQVFTVDYDNKESVVQDDEKATGKMLGMFVPYLITMMIFAGAMGLGIDSIAGEKERGTMASLLLTPVKRVNIVLGKIIAIGILSIMSAMVYIVTMLIALPAGMKMIGDGGAFEGLAISFTPVQIAELIVLILGIVLMYVAIISIVSVLAKDNKQAQTYIMPIYMVVIVVGMITMYSSGESSFGSYLIPVFNSSVAFRGIFTREITLPEFAAAAAVTYGFAAVIIALTTRAFKSEKIMFNA